MNKAVWQATRQRNWDITSGLKSNRQVRQTLSDGQQVWLQVAAYAAGLAAADFRPVIWPHQEGGQPVYGHLVRTRVKKLGACQVLVVKFAPDAPVSQYRYRVTSRLADTLATVLPAGPSRSSSLT